MGLQIVIGGYAFETCCGPLFVPVSVSGKAAMSPLRVMAGCRLYYRGGRTCTSRGRL